MRRRGQVEGFTDARSASLLGKRSMVGMWTGCVLMLDKPNAAMAVSIVRARRRTLVSVKDQDWVSGADHRSLILLSLDSSSVVNVRS